MFGYDNVCAGLWIADTDTLHFLDGLDPVRPRTDTHVNVSFLVTGRQMVLFFSAEEIPSCRFCSFIALCLRIFAGYTLAGLFLGDTQREVYCRRSWIEKRRRRWPKHGSLGPCCISATVMQLANWNWAIVEEQGKYRMSGKQKKERRTQEYTPLIKLLEGHYFDKKAHEGTIPCNPNEPKQSLKETWTTLCSFPVYKFPKAKGRQHQVCGWRLVPRHFIFSPVSLQLFPRRFPEWRTIGSSCLPKINVCIFYFTLRIIWTLQERFM